MFPVPWTLVFLYFAISVITGLVTAVCFGLLFQKLVREDRNRLFADLAMGTAAADTGIVFSAWASLNTYNSGGHRYLLWDRDGKLVDWRTFVGENEWLVIAGCAVLFVAVWHLSAIALH